MIQETLRKLIRKDFHCIYNGHGVRPACPPMKGLVPLQEGPSATPDHLPKALLYWEAHIKQLTEVDPRRPTELGAIIIDHFSSCIPCGPHEAIIRPMSQLNSSLCPVLPPPSPLPRSPLQGHLGRGGGCYFPSWGDSQLSPKKYR